jgi:hypothetical protein
MKKILLLCFSLMTAVAAAAFAERPADTFAAKRVAEPAGGAAAAEAFGRPASSCEQSCLNRNGDATRVCRSGPAESMTVCVKRALTEYDTCTQKCVLGQPAPS